MMVDTKKCLPSFFVLKLERGDEKIWDDQKVERIKTIVKKKSWN